MNYHDPDLRNALAAEYALGTLQGAARKRFESLLHNDADLQHRVEQWQASLSVLALRLAPIAPSRRVWNRIRAQLFMKNAPANDPSKSGPSWWSNLVFWRGWGLAATAAVAALLVFISVVPPPEAKPTYVVVLSNQQAQPVMSVASDNRQKQLRIKIIGQQKIDADRDYELWALPKGGPPRSLGLVSEQGETVLLVPNTMQGLTDIPALAISLEPKGGSPTGQPTGPVLFTGPVIKL
ncbi:MAG: anti-sigma factor [Burkholderiales bacterium]